MYIKLQTNTEMQDESLTMQQMMSDIDYMPNQLIISINKLIMN